MGIDCDDVDFEDNDLFALELYDIILSLDDVDGEGERDLSCDRD